MSYMGVLIDAGWIGAIASGVGAIVAIIIFLFSREKKSLSYEILSESPLISISDEIKGSLQVLFNGEPIENVHLFLVKFINDGNVPIAAGDYERQLTIIFTDDSKIISAECVQTIPSNLSPTISI